MGGAEKVWGGGAGLVVRGGIRQYVPPKCMVRLLRSVRQVHLVESLRSEMILHSSAVVMKFGINVRPDTGVDRSVGSISITDCGWLSSFSSKLVGYPSRFAGGKKSLIALRFSGDMDRDPGAFSWPYSVRLLVIIGSFRTENEQSRVMRWLWECTLSQGSYDIVTYTEYEYRSTLD